MPPVPGVQNPYREWIGADRADYLGISIRAEKRRNGMAYSISKTASGVFVCDDRRRCVSMTLSKSLNQALRESEIKALNPLSTYWKTSKTEKAQKRVNAIHKTWDEHTEHRDAIQYQRKIMVASLLYGNNTTENPFVLLCKPVLIRIATARR